jgi:hypothetical protein
MSSPTCNDVKLTGLIVSGYSEFKWYGAFGVVHFLCNYVTYVKLNKNLLHNTFICC